MGGKPTIKSQQRQEKNRDLPERIGEGLVSRTAAGTKKL
jgi:hypothetical protein